MSMGNRFETQVPTMDVAAQRVFDVNEQIQSTLSNLLTRLEPLMDTWQGTAAGSFHVLKQRWVDNASKLNEALRGIGDGLVANSTNYATTEETNTTGFSGMTGTLSEGVG
jgi:WXG100 family type VII secretion target